MTGIRTVAVAVCLAATVVTAACTRSSAGNPVADNVSSDDAPSAPATDGAGSAHPDFGVLPTVTAPVPANAVTCAPAKRPPVGMVAKVADSVAPVITVAVPNGWSMQGGTGDVGGQLSGPDGMSATITIVPTTLDPQDAFAEYADRLTGESAVSSINVLPAELCDYSGQKLLGALSDTPEDAVEFVDRIVHVWTDSRDYLVSVHTQAPTGTAEFDAAAQQLTADFEVRVP